MTDHTDDRGEKTNTELKRAVREIILSQGNRFIKELLRDNNITIGQTKDDFAENLEAAIDSGQLHQQDIESWLESVEGWGNHHIYLFDTPAIDPADIDTTLLASEHAHLYGSRISYEFSDALTLSTIDYSNGTLSVSWQRSNIKWVRTKSKDFLQTEGIDRYEYRAFRERFDRTVIRFEWAPGSDYSTLTLQLPNEDGLHDAAFRTVFDDLQALGIIENDLTKIDLGGAFKTLSRNNDTTVRSTRLMAPGGHVEFVSTLADRGISSVDALRNTRRGTDYNEFVAANGLFIFYPNNHENLTREIKVHGYGEESRIRIWVQCKREDVHTILSVIWANNESD